MISVKLNTFCEVVWISCLEQPQPHLESVFQQTELQSTGQLLHTRIDRDEQVLYMQGHGVLGEEHKVLGLWG